VVAAAALLVALGGAVLITLANRDTAMPNTSMASQSPGPDAAPG
jgi:hypothetical protein